MLKQDDVLSAGEIQNGMAQRALAVSQPYRTSSLFLVMVQVQFRDVDALIARSNNLLQIAFFQPSTPDPIEITYEACPRLAARLDDGTL